MEDSSKEQNTRRFDQGEKQNNNTGNPTRRLDNEMLPPNELPKMTLEQAKEVLEKLLLLDSNTIQSQEDLQQLGSFTEALAVMAANLVKQNEDFSTSSPNSYTILQKVGREGNNMISIMYPLEEAVQALGYISSKEQKLDFMSHHSPAKVSISTRGTLAQNLSDFLFAYTFRPIYKGQRPEDLSIDVTNKDGSYEGVRMSPDTMSFKKPLDFQRTATAAQRSASILLNWSNTPELPSGNR